ncbi:adenine deaminase [Nitratifractor sp.]|uniref:adenine deaminase n=1 Tax=Nitratifractor sp. TaxID=2268144 RepID=UPI0025FBB931|nr:adenine deaminase [Nitratifractor sp.]
MTLEANLVDLDRQTISPVALTVKGNRILKIETLNREISSYLLPGFVDAHIHIESSMLPPAEFARLAVRHGTVATVSDPHEIANVLGIPGVEYMIESAGKVPLHICFGASPCVPATPFETNGATLTPQDIATLLDKPQVGYLSEVMNFPGVIAGDPDMLAKIAEAKKRGLPVDGHCPGLRGEDLSRYIAAGIQTDHESFEYDEAKEKIEKGMKILIREGSAAKNFDALHPLIAAYPEKLMFCSDDRHPDDLQQEHINALVRRAVALGYDLFDVLRIACRHPVEHYRLPVGQLREGDFADFILVEDLESFKVRETWIKGQCVYRNGKTLIEHLHAATPNRFEALPKKAEDFYLPRCEAMEVIHAIDHQLITKEEIAAREGPDSDILKIAVINRYENQPVKGLAHISGFGLKEGAIASSVAHDSHNVVVVGCDDESMAQAANLVIASRGGIAAVGKGKKLHLPLPIAGLMSDRPGDEVAEAYATIDRFVREELGSPLSAPFMTLSFMALLVIPEIKLSDRGLFDGRQFHFIAPCRDESTPKD